MSGRLAGTGSPQLQAAQADHASRGSISWAPHTRSWVRCTILTWCGCLLVVPRD